MQGNEELVGEALKQHRTDPDIAPEEVAGVMSELMLLAWIQAFAEEKNATVAQISLAWMVDKKPYLVPIPGTRKPERLKENAGASDILLTPEEVKKIDTMLEKIPMSEVFGGTKVTK